MVSAGIRLAALSVAVGTLQELDASRRVRFDELTTWQLASGGEEVLVRRFVEYMDLMGTPAIIVCPGQPSTMAVLRAKIFQHGVSAPFMMEVTGPRRTEACLNVGDLVGVFGSGPPLLMEQVACLIGFETVREGHLAMAEAEALAMFLAGVRLLTCYGELAPLEASRTADSVIDYLCSNQDGLPHRSTFLEAAVEWT